MKPFLLLQLRTNTFASDGEFEAILKFSELKKTEVHRIRMEKDGLPKGIDLNDYSGVIVGGGQDNVSDDQDKKSKAQKRYEQPLDELLDEIVKKDFPYLGLCFGMGSLAKQQKGIVSKEKYSENAGPVTIRLRDAAENDDLLKTLPKSFRAFVGHKEACQDLPPNAVWLATSDACRFQMFKIKKNVYATQFHPELDSEGICVRIDVYKNAGYFPPEDAESLKEECKKENITVPILILKNFVNKYRQ